MPNKDQIGSGFFDRFSEGVEPGAKEEDEKEGAQDIGAPVPAQGHDPRHDQKGPDKNGRAEAGKVAVHKEEDQEDPEGMARRKGADDMEVGRKEDFPSGQGVVLELFRWGIAGKVHFQKMFEEGSQDKDDQKGHENRTLPLPPSPQEPPGDQEDRKLDLDISRPAENGPDIKGRSGKPGKKKRDFAVRKDGAMVQKEQDQPEKEEQIRERGGKGPSPQGRRDGGNRVHASVSHSGMGLWRGSANPAFPRRMTRSKARKKTPFLNLIGGPSPGSQSLGSVSVQQIRHMRGRSS